jgi:hypothetical protein
MVALLLGLPAARAAAQADGGGDWADLPSVAAPIALPTIEQSADIATATPLSGKIPEQIETPLPTNDGGFAPVDPNGFSPELGIGGFLKIDPREGVCRIKSLIDPWEGSMELGVNGVGGNSDAFNLWWGGAARHRGPVATESGWGVWIHTHSRGGQIVNTLLKDARLEFKFPSERTNFFLHSFVEYDETRAFDDRLSADLGLSHAFVQTQWTRLLVRSGLAGSKEIGGQADGFHPELYMGTELDQRLNEISRVALTLDYYPDVQRFGDYRLNVVASWQMLLVKEWNLHLKMSVIDRYDSTPHTARPNDLAYSTLMLWAF